MIRENIMKIRKLICFQLFVYWFCYMCWHSCTYLGCMLIALCVIISEQFLAQMTCNVCCVMPSSHHWH